MSSAGSLRGIIGVILPWQHHGELIVDLLTWAIVALIVSVIAGALGFTGIARGAATVAKILFGIFLAIALILFVMVLLGIGIAL